MKKLIKQYPLLTAALIIVLMGIAIHGEITALIVNAKLAKLDQAIERATFTSRSGVPPAIPLARDIVSFSGRLMHRTDFERVAAYEGEYSIKYYYRLPSDSTQGAFLFELPRRLYLPQFIN